jgi:hypothetical protein
VLKIIGGAVKNINEDLKYLPSSLAFIWVGKRISKVKTRLGRDVRNHVQMRFFNFLRLSFILENTVNFLNLISGLLINISMG